MITNKIWKRMAIAEFIIIFVCFALGLFYINYRNGFIPTGVKDVIEILVNLAIFMILIGGAGGWLILIAMFTEDKQ